MKKVCSLLLTLLLMAALFAGCGSDSDSDLQYVLDKGTLVVGITDYAPMDYRDENGNWTGFDAEFAQAFAKELGVDVEFFVLADWGQKFFELDAKNIDAIWNGMTITEEARSNASCSQPYVRNAQVVVMKGADVGSYLETPDEGQITVNGKPLLTEKADLRANRLHFGLVFQNFNLFPQYTALQNVTLAPRLAKLDTPHAIEARAEALLAQVGLADKAKLYPHQLSGGQQQRVAIARALAMNPAVLCFDEPTSALDPELTRDVLKAIRGLKGTGTTMIVVTHEMGFAKAVADVVIYMADGVIEETGTPDQVFDCPKSEKTRAFLRNAQEQF